jgi:hypothetical protein
MRNFFDRLSAHAAWLAPLVALGAMICCYPFIHWVDNLGDEGIWLDGADRLLRGERLYTDFFELHTPLGFWIVETWFRVFGPSMLAARWLALVTIALIAAFTYLSCLEVSDDLPISLGLTGAWVLWSQLAWPLQVNHHMFTTLFSVVAGWAALRHLRRPSTIMVLIAGLSAGCAAMVTQTRGALVMLAALTAIPVKPPTVTAIVSYIVACAVVPVLVLVYLVINGQTADAFRDVILFPLLHYSNIQSVEFGNLHPYQLLFFYSTLLRYFYPALGVLLAALLIQNFRGRLEDRVMWTTLALALAGLVGTFPRPDGVHISFTLPLAIPFAGYGVRCLTLRLPRLLRTVSTCAIAALLIIPSARPYRWSVISSLEAPITNTPRGPVAFSSPSMSELIKSLTQHADQHAFFYPYMPVLPFLMDMPQLSKLDVFVPYYTADYQYREACLAVLDQAAIVVFDRQFADQGVLRKIFPKMPSAPDPNELRLESALHSAFEPIWQNKYFAIMARNSNESAHLCDPLLE